MRTPAKPVAAPLAILALLCSSVVPVMPAAAQTVVPSPTQTLQINLGRGRLINLDAPIDSVFVANDTIADVSVRSPTQIYVFAKGPGETTVYATTKSGRVAYSSIVRVGNNIDSIDAMLNLAMPGAKIVATPMNGMILLTGLVTSPSDVAEAERLVQAFVGKDIQIVSRLQTSTPLQVNLQVRFAEVSRSFVKNIGVNLQNRDSGPFVFGLGRGRPGSFTYNNGTTTDANGIPPGGTGVTFPNALAGATLFGGAGNILGTTLLGSLDLGETIGQVTTLAQPNLTALSGETATFLAGGEIPIPVPQSSGSGGSIITIEYKQYGVSLAFTPTVLSDGRISLRVRPEVSQLSAAGSVQIGGTTIPALTTRRAETSVELGSGESFMIAGLLSNSHDNSIEKTPGVGDMPILGALFRSNGWKRNETELVIVITPYLVKPVNANQIALPTDGYKAADDFTRIFGGQLGDGVTGGDRPKPSMAPPRDGGPVEPVVGALALPTAPVGPRERARPAKAAPTEKKRRKDMAAAPGFGF